ncbi:ABC transporter substrate-binding protein [Pseudoalteromonas sp. S16_S37]|uniref:ABC transporter substrate-binding protein n=1 Tax=Pseudoalteromonas sp. S16_S37 TaxID=2720228 RepID=UPI001680A538|nr:ABC transporter substrate-binding protein [Pseudoalteromonas sp. S16_S37]MBD1582177.1 ABC transporter substrate-binding protein [Pseudoalteromonas sp. S16_S37]
MKYLLLTAYFVSLFISKSYALVIDLASDFDPAKTNEPTDAAMVILMKVQKALDGKLIFNHIPASRIREWRELDSHPTTCLYNKAKTLTREKQALYSKYPFTAFPANRLIVNSPLDLPQSLSIDDLITKHGLQLGVAKGRSYGEEIDRMLAAYKDRVFVNEGANSAARLRKMLLQGKLDAIIEYAPVFNYDHPHESRKQGITFHKISGAPVATFGYFVCANSEFGKQAITFFNQAMEDTQLQQDIIEFHKDLFFEQESIFIRQSLQAQFLVQ